MKIIHDLRDVLLVATGAVFFALLILAARVASQTSTPAGEHPYRGYCAICHGEKGDGKGIAAPSFGGRIADFTNPDYWKRADDKKIINVILKGRGRMPAQPVSPEEAKAIVEYMKSTFKGKYSP